MVRIPSKELLAGFFVIHKLQPAWTAKTGTICIKMQLLEFARAQAISITQSGRPEEKLELAFRLYDIDRNGSIDETEMTEIIKVGETLRCGLNWYRKSISPSR